MQSLVLWIKKILKIESRKERFTRYARENKWKNPESVSGPGSTLIYTANIRKEIPKLMKKYGMKKILDAPCGDFNWFQHIPRSASLDYTGGDIVEHLAKQNEKAYGDRHTRFLELDIVRDKLPEADVWLCRDALPHFCYSDIYDVLENFSRSKIPWLLTSTYVCTENRDIRTGSFREVNFTLEPFNFPQPEFMIDDWIESFPERRLGLWKRETIARALKKINKGDLKAKG